MKIRDGVKFADGTDLTVDSVLDTLNYYKSVPGLNDGFLKPLTVEAEGSDSVRVSSDEPFRGMESIFCSNGCNNGMIISAAGLKDPEKLKTDMFGAGPYVYVAERERARRPLHVHAEPELLRQVASELEEDRHARDRGPEHRVQRACNGSGAGRHDRRRAVPQPGRVQGLRRH